MNDLDRTLGATYDPDADALYVRLSESRRLGPAVEVGHDYVVHVDTDGVVVGVEMLNVAHTARCVAAAHLARRREAAGE